jgi:hypothetical protein
MPAVNREFEITYGSFVMGGSTAYQTTGPYRIQRTFESWSISFQLVITETTAAAFATLIGTVEDNLAKRYQRLIVKIGSSTIVDYNPSTNSGFNTRATCVKAGTEGADTGRSRVYDVTLSTELPATDQSGRRDSSVTIDYTPSRKKTVTVSGVWTAAPSSGTGYSNYSAQIGSFCSSALGTVGGTFELVGENAKWDDANKVVIFSRVYREIVSNQGNSLDDAAIVEHSIIFRRLTSRPGDTRPGTKRLEGIAISWSSSVDKTNTTDLESVYQGTIRPYVVQKARTLFGLSAVAIVDESHDCDLNENKIIADIQIMATTSGTDYIESRESTRYVEQGGTVFTNAWAGNIYSKWVDQGHGSRQRIVERTYRRLGEHQARMRLHYAPQADGLFYLVGFESSAQILRLGQDDSILTVTDLHEVETWEYAVEPGGAAPIPGGPAITPPPGPFQAPGGSIPQGIR